MTNTIRIGTRESQLAVWQATRVKESLARRGYSSELVYIKSEGDVDLKTPLYEMGVQGIFTRALDTALLNNEIDLAVHSFKDVPTQLPEGIQQAAVLWRGPVHDLLVFKNEEVEIKKEGFIVATSSIRRKAQWLNQYPHHTVVNLRGNVNTRLQKLQEENWDAAIFAQAGLERINLRPQHSIVLDWMLPAPAQGAIVVLCRNDDEESFNASATINHKETAITTKIERDFLRTMMGGCSMPVSALAEINEYKGTIFFRGSIVGPDGKGRMEVGKVVDIDASDGVGKYAAEQILQSGGREILESVRKNG